MTEGVDVIVLPYRRINYNSRPAVQAFKAWVGREVHRLRQAGWKGWIAAQGQGERFAGDYWIWQFDKEARLMEYTIFRGGDVGQYGHMHGGLGWRFPLLAIFVGDDRPTDADLAQLQAPRGNPRFGVPYALDVKYLDLPEDEDEDEDEDGDEDGDEDDEGEDEDEGDEDPCRKNWSRKGLSWRRRVDRKLDYLICRFDELSATLDEYEAEYLEAIRL